MRRPRRDAATSHKQSAQPAKKPEAKKPEAKKPEAAKPRQDPARVQARSALRRRPRTSKGKPSKHAAKSKRSKKPAADDDDDGEDEKAAAPALTGDLAAVKKAIDLARKGETEDATEAIEGDRRSRRAKARRMVLAAPSRDRTARFARFAAFLNNNPDWPSNALMRRRAEARLWQEKADAATIRGFFAEKAPLTAKGRFALARVLLADGDRLAAAREVKAAWRSEELGEATEAMAYEEFRELLGARGSSRAHGQADRRQGDFARRCAPPSGSATMMSRSSKPAAR